MAKKLNYSLFAGEYRRITVSVVDDATPPVPVPLAGLTIRYCVGMEPRAVPLITKSTAAGSIQLVGDGSTGQFAFELLERDTRNLDGAFYHEARLEDVGGAPSVLLYGEFVIAPSLARA